MFQVSNLDYADELTNNKTTVFVDILDIDTGKPAIFEVEGKVVYGPYKGEYGASIGVATEDFKDDLKMVDELFKDKFLKKYKKTVTFKEYKDHKDVVFFKLKADKEGLFYVKSSVEIQDEDKEIIKNLDLRDLPICVKTSVGVFLNSDKKEYGFFYKPVELLFQ